MLDDLGDVCFVTRPNFTQNALVGPNDATNKPVSLNMDYEKRDVKVDIRLTQKTPMLLNEQKGCLSGLIMHHIPWNCHVRKKTRKRW